MQSISLLHKFIMLIIRFIVIVSGDRLPACMKNDKVRTGNYSLIWSGLKDCSPFVA